jgi:hypothetical protein
MTPVQSDPVFVQFDDPKWGIRAMARILMAYRARGLNTVTRVITAWSPPSENNTGAYITFVADYCHVDAGDIIDPVSPRLIEAIIQHENDSQPYTDALIKEGISLTGTTSTKSWTPNAVPAAAGVGVAGATILVWAIKSIWPHLAVPDDVVFSINAICAAAGAYLHPAGRS